uniref:Uncharacterized protein n=1 Tax=Rhizophora mucronata TaxID=61149 RepID=A0A2P2Q1P0_RHIMU
MDTSTLSKLIIDFFIFFGDELYGRFYNCVKYIHCFTNSGMFSNRMRSGVLFVFYL